MITQRNINLIIIGFWLFVAGFYCIHTPYGERTHDLWGHIEYTRIVVNEHRLPTPHEKWETFQPPLYYLINSVLAPSLINTNEAIHINYARMLSVFYGLVSLLIMSWLMKDFISNAFHRLLAIFFVATTPKFVFIFSTYNNDSLATFLCIVVLALSYKLSSKWSKWQAIALFCVAVGALYAKVLSGFVIVIVSVYCCRNLLYRKMPSKEALKIIGILFLASATLLPWMYFHNYKHTKKLLPTNADHSVNKEYNLRVLKNLAGIVFRIPQLQIYKVDYTHEWDKPWQYPDWGGIPKETKRYDYFANSFVTSIVGEHILLTPNVLFIWIIYWIHFIAGLLGVFYCRGSKLATFSFAVIALAYLIQISTISMFLALPQRNMAFRYIAWTWMCWANLYATTLSKDGLIPLIFRRLLLIGIILQVYVLMTLST